MLRRPCSEYLPTSVYHSFIRDRSTVSASPSLCSTLFSVFHSLVSVTPVTNGQPSKMGKRRGRLV